MKTDRPQVTVRRHRGYGQMLVVLDDQLWDVAEGRYELAEVGKLERLEERVALLEERLWNRIEMTE